MTNPSLDFDIAVIGAGMAGLTCAQQLQQTGDRVVILEKSRGVGGRIATRRLHETLADHGTCYLTPKG
ncbi:MAG TPA: FAD-dependent oxidoreductase, partial [Thermosynechococcaceae cyanobacterium]